MHLEIFETQIKSLNRRERRSTASPLILAKQCSNNNGALQSGARDLSLEAYLLLRNAALIREIALVTTEIHKF